MEQNWTIWIQTESKLEQEESEIIGITFITQ